MESHWKLLSKFVIFFFFKKKNMYVTKETNQVMYSIILKRIFKRKLLKRNQEGDIFLLTFYFHFQNIYIYIQDLSQRWWKMLQLPQFLSIQHQNIQINLQSFLKDELSHGDKSMIVYNYRFFFFFFSLKRMKELHKNKIFNSNFSQMNARCNSSG